MRWKFRQVESLALFIEVLKQICRIEDYEIVGNELYGLSRTDDGRRFIVVCLLESRGDRWAYQLFDEAMHPYCYNCPPRLLNASEIPDTSLWRERCWGFGQSTVKLDNEFA